MVKSIRTSIRTGLVVALSLVLFACAPEGDELAGRTPADEPSQAALEVEQGAEDIAAEADADALTSTRFQLGTHYTRLSPVQPTSSSADRVEVAEVFWYGCPHCYDFEPYIARWEASKPAWVSFVRIPAVWNPAVRLHARAFYTAEALGKLEEMHTAFFDEFHRAGNPLSSEAALAAFFGRFGVDEATFRDTFDSMGVQTRLQRAEELALRYRITGVPTIVVNGKYVSGASSAGSYEALIELIDELAAAERPGD